MLEPCLVEKYLSAREKGSLLNFVFAKLKY